jgi:hypothetical protein
MHPAMMLLGFTRAVSRFLGDEGTASLSETLSVAMENEGHPNIKAVLGSAFGSGKDSPWDLDEELTSIERYFALFEALNWADCLDDRLTIDWPFEEIAHGRYWCDEFRGGGLIRGLRFARNSVHHDWSLALDLDPLENPFHQRIELLWLCWAEGLAGEERSDGATAYMNYLAGRAAGETLFEIGDILTAAVNIAAGDFPRQGPVQPRSRSPPTTSTSLKTPAQRTSR